ncbi:DNA replication protein DnaC [Kitasatospora sp. MAP12-15]|uniref:ATP-binding protein n=1 Tax=unclassified Kitasatospora TaxID=2633591 RepID=UPI002473FEB6|nr:ATP-binding protein [Kitasatospora sp. MAP12-44]MDH6110216.1 DNA replication protein DnaC [Kitasatospora sp. MAP12-44]
MNEFDSPRPNGRIHPSARWDRLNANDATTLFRDSWKSIDDVPSLLSLPAKHRAFGIDQLTPTEYNPDEYKTVAAWVENLSDQQHRDGLSPADTEGYGQGLYLSGPYGTGKTTIAAAALVSVYRAGNSVGFIRFTDLLAAHRPAPGNERRLEDDLERKEEAGQLQGWKKLAREAGVLLIDDVGQEREIKGSEFAEDILTSTLRSRFNAGLPTMVSTNLTLDRWRARYGDALASFIHEAFAHFLFFGGPDLRSTR